MPQGFKSIPTVRPSSLATNFNTDPKILRRLCYNPSLTDEENEAIFERDRKRDEERKKAWLNKPILPPTESDEFKIIRKEVPYGGTNGNPVTEGVQKVVTVETLNQDDSFSRVNFYSRDELAKFISQLKEAMNHLD